VYQINGQDKIFSQLERMSDSSQREVLLAWLADIAEAPHECGARLPGKGVPVYLAVGRLGALTIKYLVAEQFRTVNIIEFGHLP
jgi:hypothetical protein